tara:strand:- start:125 stop:331 length:207 start_codon:yes stop_codon:yes gene_type:complete
MTLPLSGPLNLGRIHAEANNLSGTLTSQVSINETDVRALINKTFLSQSSFSEFRGAQYPSGGGGGFEP